MKKRLPTYSKLQVLMASPTEPMPPKLRDHHLHMVYTSLAALEKAESPTTDDWRICSDAVNLMETLIEMGHIQDADGLLSDAITALALAGKRNLAGGKIRLDGEGIKAMRSIIQDYEMCITELPHRVMMECHRRTEQRVREILAGRKRPHDVEVVDL